MLSILRIVFATLGGALVVSLVWLLLNGLPGKGQPGWLEREPWPFSSLLACAAIGAALCLLQAATRWHQRSHAESLADTATRLRLEFTETVPRRDLGAADHLGVFRGYLQGCNQFSGRFEGLELQMLDVTSAQQSSEQRGVKFPRSDARTVVVIALRTDDWPVFEIHPRGLSTWAWDLLGCRGATFRFRDEFGVIALDRSALARFNRRYRVFFGVAQRIAELAGMYAGLPVGSKPAEEAKLADRFTMSTLRRFAETRGWTVESCGTHAALYRKGKILPAARREAFLRETCELYRSLAAPPADAADANLVIEATDFDSANLGQKLSGVIAGVLAGMVAAVLLSVPLLLAMPIETAGVFVFAWPFVALAFMVLGAYCGSRLAAPNRLDR